MEGGCFRQWRAGCNGISERLMTVKRAQTHPHKTDYPSVTEAAERGWVEGGRWCWIVALDGQASAASMATGVLS